MERLIICIFIALCFASESIARTGFGPGEQEWGFVQVRPDANMFWWLYYTTANVTSYYDKPLIIWLQGGPGNSSTAYGNFEELGPLDIDLKPRNYTWVKDYNVLFIDNPVGAGFSNVKNISLLVKTNAQIASDLLECMKGFYQQLPKFKPVPTYIVTESYGGKMGVEFALVWDRAQKAGTIESNLKGIALGNAWISPIDSVMTWAPYLRSTGLIDTKTFEKIDYAAKVIKYHANIGLWQQAYFDCLSATLTISIITYNVDLYNILTKIKYKNSYLSRQSVSSFNEGSIYLQYLQDSNQTLNNLMNGPVKEALGLNATYGNQSTTVFFDLRGDIMKNVTNIVEQLLNETNLKVFVYNGQLDLFVDTPGTLAWIEKLNWKDADKWKTSERQPLVSEAIIEGYFKGYNNFWMYWVNRAGHMVPRDNPAAMKLILENLTSNSSKRANQ